MQGRAGIKKMAKSKVLTRAKADGIVDEVKRRQDIVKDLEDGLEQIHADAADDMRKFRTSISQMLVKLKFHADQVSEIAKDVQKTLAEDLMYGEFMEDYAREAFADAMYCTRACQNVGPELAQKLDQVHAEDECRQRWAIRNAEKELARAQHRAYKADL
jgi:hypothetical protein